MYKWTCLYNSDFGRACDFASFKARGRVNLEQLNPSHKSQLNPLHLILDSCFNTSIYRLSEAINHLFHFCYQNGRGRACEACCVAEADLTTTHSAESRFYNEKYVKLNGFCLHLY